MVCIIATPGVLPRPALPTTCVSKEKVRSIRTLLTMANKNKIEVVSKGRNTQE